MADAIFLASREKWSDGSWSGFCTKVRVFLKEEFGIVWRGEELLDQEQLAAARRLAMEIVHSRVALINELITTPLEEMAGTVMGGGRKYGRPRPGVFTTEVDRLLEDEMSRIINAATIVGKKPRVVYQTWAGEVEE